MGQVAGRRETQMEQKCQIMHLIYLFLTQILNRTGRFRTLSPFSLIQISQGSHPAFVIQSGSQAVMKKKRYVDALGKSEWGRVGQGWVGRSVGLQKLGAISRPENLKSILLVKIRIQFFLRKGSTAFPLPRVKLVKCRVSKYINVPYVGIIG